MIPGKLPYASPPETIDPAVPDMTDTVPVLPDKEQGHGCPHLHIFPLCISVHLKTQLMTAPSQAAFYGLFPSSASDQISQLMVKDLCHMFRNRAAGIFPLAKTADPIADQRKKDPSTDCPHLLKRKRILVFAATTHFPVHFRYKIQPLPPLHFHFRDHLQRSAA